MAIIIVKNNRIRNIFDINEKTFHLSESEEFVSITYDTNKIFHVISDIYINSIMTIDLRRDLIDSSTALVLEWFPDVDGYYYYVDFLLDVLEEDEVFP